VVFIFQLPAISGIRIPSPSVIVGIQ